MSLWSIMVYMNGKNDLEPYAIENFKQIAKIGSTRDVKVLVEFGRPHRHYSQEYGAWSETCRFLVEKDMPPTLDAACERLGKTNMGDGAYLTDFVVWAKNKFPADRYMLVIWDHGQGWRLKMRTKVRATPEEIRAYAQRRRQFVGRSGAAAGSDALAENEVIPGGLRWCGLDEDTGDKLYNRAIQDAIADALGEARLDVLGFDACLMGMLETAYGMRNVSKVLVASEELEPGDGWPYDAMLSALRDKPKMDGKGVGRTVVQTYGETYPSSVTMAALDLEGMGEVARKFSLLAQRCTASLQTELDAVVRARADCESYAAEYGMSGIDAGRWLENFAGLTKNADLQERARKAREGIANCIIAKYASKDRDEGTKYGSTGLAIYFPKSGFAFSQDRDHDGYEKKNSCFPIEFVQTYKWADFLAAYFALVPK
jgi:Clostripain family